MSSGTLRRFVRFAGVGLFLRILVKPFMTRTLPRTWKGSIAHTYTTTTVSFSTSSRLHLRVSCVATPIYLELSSSLCLSLTPCLLHLSTLFQIFRTYQDLTFACIFEGLFPILVFSGSKFCSNIAYNAQIPSRLPHSLPQVASI